MIRSAWRPITALRAQRVFITGLSAGGAMAMVMLATYPEVFAGGAIIAGLPFGVATNVREALSRMHSPRTARSPRKLGDLVRKASAHKGPWPKLSVWHGSADRVVHPGNADEIVKQWLDLHHLPAGTDVGRHGRRPSAPGLVERRRRDRGRNPTPSPTWRMARRSALADNEQRYGAQGAFLIEAGISSSYHVAKFFGLTEWIRRPRESLKPPAKQAVKQPAKPSAEQAAKPAASVAAKK